jgi:hypothetical protein
MELFELHQGSNDFQERTWDLGWKNMKYNKILMTFKNVYAM